MKYIIGISVAYGFVLIEIGVEHTFDIKIGEFIKGFTYGAVCITAFRIYDLIKEVKHENKQ